MKKLKNYWKVTSREEDKIDCTNPECVTRENILYRVNELERRVYNIESTSSSQILIVQKTLAEVGKVIAVIKQLGEKT